MPELNIPNQHEAKTEVIQSFEFADTQVIQSQSLADKARSKVIYDIADVAKHVSAATDEKSDVFRKIKENISHFLADNQAMEKFIRAISEAKRNNKSAQEAIREFVVEIVEDILKNVECPKGNGAIYYMDFPEEYREFEKRINNLISGIEGVLIEEFEILKFIPDNTQGLPEDFSDHTKRLKFEAFATAVNIRSDLTKLLGNELVRRGIADNVGLIGVELGKGGIGTVYSCDIDGKRIAVKLSHSDLSDKRLINKEVLNSKKFIKTTINSPFLMSHYGILDVDYSEKQAGYEGRRQMELSEEIPNAKDLNSHLYGLGYKYYKMRDDIEKVEFKDFLQTYFLPALRGIKDLHDNGFIHRDIKPANIIVSSKDQTGDYVVKVGDFGLVCKDGFLEIDEERVVGTPSYMSPEQCRNKMITTKSDIYSLGKMLYDFVGGEKPQSVSEAMFSAMKGIDLKELDIPPNVKEVIEKCLKLKPEERSNIDELINDVERLIKEGEEIEMHIPSLMKTAEIPL